MTLLIRLTNGSSTAGEQPITYKNFKELNPNTSFPYAAKNDICEEYGYGVYTPTSKPDESLLEDNQIYKEGPAVFDEDIGLWTQNWEAVTTTAEEQTEKEANSAQLNRNMRDSKLRATDFWGTSDNVMTDEMSTYRQALRDISSHTNWPFLSDDDWPTAP